MNRWNTSLDTPQAESSSLVEVCTFHGIFPAVQYTCCISLEQFDSSPMNHQEAKLRDKVSSGWDEEYGW